MLWTIKTHRVSANCARVFNDAFAILLGEAKQ
ncbi:hypothetical protein AT5A_15317 [Agrobacterium tumefaciens 5A]|nr:hypothetical protein AT5A_15317 [Agrobacterium tumefaciens 5A]